MTVNELERALRDAATTLDAPMPYDLVMRMHADTAKTFDRMIDPIRRIGIVNDQPVMTEQIKFRFGQFEIRPDDTTPSGEIWIFNPRDTESDPVRVTGVI